MTKLRFRRDTHARTRRAARIANQLIKLARSWIYSADLQHTRTVTMDRLYVASTSPENRRRRLRQIDEQIHKIRLICFLCPWTLLTYFLILFITADYSSLTLTRTPQPTRLLIQARLWEHHVQREFGLVPTGVR
jgi:hypothetical protein